MVQRFNAILVGVNHEWWSKLTDGLLAAVVLVLLWWTTALLVRPIEVVFGIAGLLIYALVLLAVSMFCLQQSLLSRRADIIRAWYGIIGGFLAWAVAKVVGSMDVPILPSPAAVILPIMVALIVAQLWRTILPLGMRLFSLTFLLNWAEYILFTIQQWLVARSSVFILLTRFVGVLAAFGALLVLGWVMFRTRRRVQRIGGALAFWFLISIVFYIFYGWFL